MALNASLQGQQLFSLDFDGDFYVIVFRPAGFAADVKDSALIRVRLIV